MCHFSVESFVGNSILCYRQTNCSCSYQRGGIVARESFGDHMHHDIERGLGVDVGVVWG